MSLSAAHPPPARSGTQLFLPWLKAILFLKQLTIWTDKSTSLGLAELPALAKGAGFRRPARLSCLDHDRQYEGLWLSARWCGHAGHAAGLSGQGLIGAGIAGRADQSCLGRAVRADGYGDLHR